MPHATAASSRAGRPLVVALTTALVAACASGPDLPPYDGSLALGAWGGDNSGMIVSDTAMHLHIGCTYGDASGRVAITRNGDIDISGSYMLHAYPVAVGPSMPARFVGHLDGKDLTVTVTVNDTITHETVTLGPTKMRFGTEPQMQNCPICRRPIYTRKPNHT